eukprot:CAMPEP_0174955356 /NCGR_PEP_ID=MMETSP0004_2-20121128/937_1 /TAXON_ID=420556 /ORGANISM="Ochromonas sp., Strain CCMP1393" /LENGTH=295 /DNA_ID=CAMNT_0016203277 /DNA_START=308 /DNA_END=1195 /DNA_ORIENTATION=+
MQVNPVVGGSVVALVTPMTADNKIDFPKFVELLQWHVKEGTDGAVILGTTGEASTISMEERTEIIKTAVSTVDKAFPIIVGTGTIDPPTTLQLCENARACGADATLVITPYYVKPPQRALVSHFRMLADTVDLPMILYNCPGRTGVDMKPETISLVSAHPNIIGVKEATGDLDRVKAIRGLCGEEFLIFSGEDDSGCEFMKLGGDGVISVTANVAPKDMHKMLTGAKKGDAEADSLNDSLMPLHQRLFLESNPIPAKKALQLMGKIDSGIRPPLCPLDDVHIAALTEALKAGKAI